MIRSVPFSLIIILSAGFANSAPLPKQKSNADLLVGEWKLVKSDETVEGVTFTVEFTKDGKLTVIYEHASLKTTQKFTGTYKIDKDKIDYTLGNGDGERKETLTIEKLTEEELIVTDPDKKREEFKRIVRK